jgi:signal transduction histidine kinase
MDNACKWASFQVKISVSKKDECLFIQIEDDGSGIKPEQRVIILDRGKRLDEKTEGQGLGLSIVIDIIKQYQGNLTIQSSHLGGALFLITIPLK